MCTSRGPSNRKQAEFSQTFANTLKRADSSQILPLTIHPKLRALVDVHGLRWADISRHMEGRTDQQCMGRWRRHLDPLVKRDTWSTGEDRRLAELRVAHGANWSAIAKQVENRTAQQCRARWFQAHFTGHVYLDANGTLLSKQECDVQEAAVTSAKAAAAASGKTLRPNGVKQQKAHSSVENVMKAKGVVKEETGKGGTKKRARNNNAGSAGSGAGSGFDGETSEERRRRLARDASGRFAPKDDGVARATPVATPATTPAKPFSEAPALRKKPHAPRQRRVALATNAARVSSRGEVYESENNNVGASAGRARALSLSLKNLLPVANGAWPPDVADFMAKQAALVSPASARTSPAASPAAVISDPPPVLKDRASSGLTRNGSSFLFRDDAKPSSPFELAGAGLATMSSGDWGLMLGGDIGSVAAMLETASKAMREETQRVPNMTTGIGNDSFKLAIERMTPTLGERVPNMTSGIGNDSFKLAIERMTPTLGERVPNMTSGIGNDSFKLAIERMTPTLGAR